MTPRGSESRPAMLALGLTCLLAAVAAVWIALPRRPQAARTPPPPPAAPAAPVAQIVRVPRSSDVVINLGLSDQIVQGMTFDVYDKQAGVPAARGGGAAAPPKAWIEITRIGPGFSECRIVRRSEAVPVAQGDLVVPRATRSGVTANATPASR